MARLIFTTGTGAGHVYPVLPIAATLLERGHEIVWVTGRAYKTKVESTGSIFHPFPESIDSSLVGIYEFFPEYAKLRGITQTRYMLKHLFLDACIEEMKTIDHILQTFPADVIVSDVAIFAPYFKSELGGPPSVLISFVPLAIPSRDTAPYGLGLLPGTNWLSSIRNQILNFIAHRILLRDVTQHANNIRNHFGLPPLDKPFLRAMFEIPEMVISLTTQSFEYPRSDLPNNVHFVGPTFPEFKDDFQLPDWWEDLNKPLPVILVNQGTEATNLEDLILPTIEGLKDQPVLIIAIPVQEHQLVDVPDNVHAATFIPFDQLLPHVDIMVTNGGYGGTQLALAHGIPLVVAGETEDKMEVAARVEWAGAGINLHKQNPSAKEIRTAVGEILSNQNYQQNAKRIQLDYVNHDAPKEASELLESIINS